MTEAGTSQQSTSLTVTEETSQSSRPLIRLKLQKPKNDKKLKWAEGTVDNEHLNKKKSKCCCIYEKPKLFGELSSDESGDDDCTNHCRGHKKKCYQHNEGEHTDHAGPSQQNNADS